MAMCQQNMASASVKTSRMARYVTGFNRPGGVSSDWFDGCLTESMG